VYRHFPSRKALLEAAIDWTNARIGHEGDRPTREEELVALVRQTFRGFEAHAAVVRRLLMEPDGLAARVRDVDSRRRAALELVRNEVPGLDEESTARIAAAVQVLTLASTWDSLHAFWDQDGDEAAETAVLAVQLLLEAARARTTRSANTEGEQP
jgi:AcrR family transcriptional regulator